MTVERRWTALAALAATTAMALGVAACGADAPPGKARGTRKAAVSCPGRAPIDPRRIYAPTSFWNAPIPADAPIAADSQKMADELAAVVAQESTQRTGPWINTGSDSIPVYGAAACQRGVRVHLDKQDPALQRAIASVPIPPGARPAPGTDQTMVVYQPSRDRIWEFWIMRRLRDGWHAKAAGVMDHVSKDPGYFRVPGWGASASGVGIAGGLMRPGEMRAGRIDHALALAVPNVRAGQFVAPARRTDGRVAAPAGIPEGTRLRLDPALDVTQLGLSPLATAIARAAQQYGIVVRDYAGNVAFYGADPQSLGAGADPYAPAYGGKQPDEVLANFPWNRLQVLQARRSG